MRDEARGLLALLVIEGVYLRSGEQQKKSGISLLGASAWLALLLIATKAATWDKPWLGHFFERLLGLLMSSWTDVLFALACGVIGTATVFVLQKLPRAAAIARGFFLGFFALCALYGVASIGLFRYFNRPITFELFAMIGNATAVRSSIFDRLGIGMALALLLVPIVFLIIAIRSRRWPRLTRGLLVFAMIWLSAGFLLQRNYWKEQQLTHLWLSPHFELLRTTAVRLMGGQRPSFPKDFPPSYVDEFRTFGARGLTSSSYFELPAGMERPKNVIIIVLESVGTKYLRLYGSDLNVMPRFEAEANNALVFDNIYAHASFTYASFRTINFSIYPGLPWHYSVLGDARALPGTLAAKMRARGARTAYINNGNLYWEDEHWLLEKSGAFDSLDDYSTVGCPPLSSWGTEDRCDFDRLIRWIDEKPNESFFAICWTDQTHDPYPISPGVTPIDFFAGKAAPPLAKDLSAYLNVMHETDKHLGEMFDALRARGIADDTLVVITGDHGEAFADPHDQRGHAWSVFEEETHVPLMFWNPRLFPNGSRAPIIGGHVDMNPTIVDLLDMAPDAEWQGYSLFDPAKPNRVYFMAIAGGDIFGVREGDWKYIYDVTSARESLFNLRDDPLEQHDAIANETARAKNLRQRVAAWVTFEDAFLWGKEN
ncbi:MAG: sulfatase-like hydrolase/transferase [Verrucomicrobiota bacterium]|nr:sulfatase-like hydrolase/transferase [Verrucomicrobiota bacterium]